MMIVRSAARRRRSNLLAASFAQLNLPWLAPAQLRWLASHNNGSTTTSGRLRTRCTGRERRDSTPLRRLATSADVVARPSLEGAYDDSLLSGRQHRQWAWQDPIPSDPGLFRKSETPILLNTTTKLPPPDIRVQLGLHGSPLVLLQHLNTSIRIGRLSRARAIVQRLQQEREVTPAELAYAHSVYLEGLLNNVRSHSAGSKEAVQAYEDMQQWFYEEVHENGIAINGRMLVHMVSATIHATTGSVRDEAINTYVRIGSEINDDVHDEVLFSDEYDDEEFNTLSRATDPEAYSHDAVKIGDQDTLTQADEHQHQSVESNGHYRRADSLSPGQVPEMIDTILTGSGLTDIKRALDPLRHASASPTDAPVDAQRTMAYERQRILEETSLEVAIDKWRAADAELRKIGINTSLQTRSISALLWSWYAKLLPVVQEEQKLCREILNDSATGRIKTTSSHTERLGYAPFLELMPAEKLAAATILFVLSHLARGKNTSTDIYELKYTVVNMADSLGKYLQSEMNAHDSAKAWHSNGPPQSRSSRGSLRRKHSKPVTSQTDSVREQSEKWTPEIRVRVGSCLLKMVIETAQLPVTREHIRTKEKVTQLQPALMHRIVYVKGKRQGMIVPNQSLVDKLETEPVASALAKRMPMVVEPEPWTGWKEGGYIHYQNPIMRLPGTAGDCEEYFRAAHEQGDLGQLYAGLNALSSVPWHVNLDVLKVQIEAWNSGEPVGNFAPLHPKFDYPEEPEASADLPARRRWIRELREIENTKSGYHSQRCFQNFQLYTARAMANETLYLPHNIDFRGRAYPIPPYLNHMGADNVRSLLVFADGKELGEEGLRWLKIHLANVAGYDKASLQEREDFTMQHLDDVRDSVQDPLGGRQWWRKSEDAWQTLAACFELIHALDSPDPRKFVSHLPIHQDGTCNGLQHYAALGGDTAGATHVNLAPGDRPADIYSAVADSVRKEVDRDAAEGNPVAKMLQGHITRKVVKQPVMTNVYGVTSFGATAQVKKQLEDIFPHVKRDSEITHGQMASYISAKIFTSLGTMFTGAQAIQSWLGQCADRITRCVTSDQVAQLRSLAGVAPSVKARSRRTRAEIDSKPEAPETVQRQSVQKLFKSTVIWTTPLGLPVVQPYRVNSTCTVKSALQTMTVFEPQIWDQVARRKQLQAFPPNFIHSLDATHMLLSASKCREVGLTFASIHDSFWTHACDVGQMSMVLRDAFVAMHSDDLIGRLHEEFEMRYSGAMYLTEVLRSSPAAKKITAWRKKNPQYSSTSFGELELEFERARLLKSSDEAERKRGEDMVTPCSILEGLDNEGVYTVFQGLHDRSLGAAPTFEETGEAQQTSEEAEEEAEEGTRPKRQSKKGAAYTPRLSVWQPVKFPQKPAKGDFDVKQLRDSKYFFS